MPTKRSVTLRKRSQSPKKTTSNKNKTTQRKRSTSQRRRSTSQRRRSTSQRRRSTSQRRRSTSQEKRSTSQRRRSTSQRRRSTSQRRRSTSQRRRSTSQERRSTSQERRSTSQERRSTSQRKNANNQRKRLHLRRSQNGGGSSDYANSWYSSLNDYPLDKLNAYTTANINNSPVFNPFSPTAKFASGTAGVIPTGMYYGVGGKGSKSAKPKAKKPVNTWVVFIMKKKVDPKYKHLKFQELLKNAELKVEYRKLHPKK